MRGVKGLAISSNQAKYDLHITNSVFEVGSGTNFLIKAESNSSTDS